MKGIILAGGSGTRLSPSTISISKQLIPIYDKPMVYYPLSMLMLAGIREILIISTSEHLPLYEKLFGNGSRLGLKLSYKEQETPRGLADAFILGEEFIGNDSVCLVLGDNICYGYGLNEKLQKSAGLKNGGIIFGYHVNDPSRYGVLELDKDNKKVLSVEEKPKEPKSNYAITGIYFFDNKCIEYAKHTKPSARGEIEITSVIQRYVDNGNLDVELITQGFAWLDTGTNESLLEASNFVCTIEKRQGLKIGCLEEIAYNQGFTNLDQLKKAAVITEKSQYGQYLQKLILALENKQ